MRVFLDTEFSDFDSPELLSLGMVAGEGRELYIERRDAGELAVTDFVREEVLPLFGRESPEVLDYDAIGDRVVAWFDQLRDGDRSIPIEVVSDSGVDFRLMTDLLPNPAWLQSVNVICELAQALLSGREFDTYLEHADARHDALGIRHHALIDARVMREAFMLSHDPLFSRCFDYSPPAGWKPIVDRCISDIRTMLDEAGIAPGVVSVQQVKEKMGGLRIYVDGLFVTPSPVDPGESPSSFDVPGLGTFDFHHNVPVEMRDRVLAAMSAAYAPDDEQSQRIRDRIRAVEKEAARTCQKCGQPGALVNKAGWYVTVCETHRTGGSLE